MGEYRAAVAGESFSNDDGSSRQEEISRCRVGEAVTLEREPDNQYDENCIRVMSARGVQIGNVSREAGWIAERMDRGGAVSATIDSIGRGDRGMLGVVLAISTDEKSSGRDKLPPPSGSVVHKVVGPEPEQKEDAKKGCVIVFCICVAIAFVAQMSHNGSPANKTADAKEEQETAAAKAEEKRKGFHCLSSWDGSSKQFVALVKANLRDPDSFEHDETRVAPVKDGKHAIMMNYRAKNGFGGVNRGIAVGTLDHETCAATLVASE